VYNKLLVSFLNGKPAKPLLNLRGIVGSDALRCVESRMLALKFNLFVSVENGPPGHNFGLDLDRVISVDAQLHWIL
jgi:hypothetical protein